MQKWGKIQSCAAKTPMQTMIEWSIFFFFFVKQNLNIRQGTPTEILGLTFFSTVIGKKSEWRCLPPHTNNNGMIQKHFFFEFKTKFKHQARHSNKNFGPNFFSLPLGEDSKRQSNLRNGSSIPVAGVWAYLISNR